MNHASIRKEITERLVKNWNFNEQRLADLSLFHLVSILMLLAGPYGYIGQFAPTIYALRETLGEDQVFDKPSELRARQVSPTEPEVADQPKLVTVN